MRKSAILSTGLAIMSAVALGFGTIFGTKANLDDHWSASPTLVHEVNAPSADSGSPKGDSTSDQLSLTTTRR